MAFPMRAARPGDILEADEELDPDGARAGGGGRPPSPSAFSCAAFMRAARPGDILPEPAGAAAAGSFFSPPPPAEEEAEEDGVSFMPSIRAASPGETRGESPALTGELDGFCSVSAGGQRDRRMGR